MEADIAVVRIVTREGVRRSELPPGLSGTAATGAYFNGKSDPLHLHAHVVNPEDELHIGPRAIDCLAYVWQGSVEVQGYSLPSGSSLVAEHGASVTIAGGAGRAIVLSFTAAEGGTEQRPGGHVHLLPADRVPRVAEMGSGAGIAGGMHFDSACPTCEVWLHELHFPPSEPMSPEEERRGAHTHPEDEIIFVTRGHFKLENKLFGPGTALAIAANTVNYFHPGPDGLSFINYRASAPGAIRFPDGRAVSETGNWKRLLGGKRPEYLEPAHRMTSGATG
jgi:hypothetical protein